MTEVRRGPVLGDPSVHPVREDAFLTYSAARLAGLFWYGPLTDSRIADLHRIRLGKAVTGPATDKPSGVRYRVFERVLVAVNWDKQSAKNLPGQSLVANALGKNPQDFRFFSALYTGICRGASIHAARRTRRRSAVAF